MSPNPCPSPELQERILCAVRDGIQLDPEAVAHHAHCQACRVASERLSRMRRVWQVCEASPREVARLRARFEARRERRAPVWGLTVALGGLLLTAYAAAQSGVLPQWLRALSVGEQPAQRAPAPTPPPPPRLGPAASEPAGQPQPAAEPAPEPAVEPAPEAAMPARPHADPSWRRVARALREGDHASAERALKRLSGAGEPRVRDTARLTLAQLWLQQGYRAKARRVLRRLARHGATPLVRRRAAELSAGP